MRDLFETRSVDFDRGRERERKKRGGVKVRLKGGGWRRKEEVEEGW